MPLYKPKFLTPNALTDVATVDITQPFKPTCVIDGDAPINAYQIDIGRLKDNVHCGYDIVRVEEEVKITKIDSNNTNTYYFKISNDAIDGIVSVSYTSANVFISVQASLVENMTYRFQNNVAPNKTVKVVYLKKELALYSTNRIELPEVFCCSNEHGAYNIFQPIEDIILSEIGAKYIVEELQCEIGCSDYDGYVWCLETNPVSIDDIWYITTHSNDGMEWHNLGMYAKENSYEYSITYDQELNKYVIIPITGNFPEWISSGILNDAISAFIKYSPAHQTTPFTYKMSFWDVNNKLNTPSVSSNETVFYAHIHPTVTLRLNDSVIDDINNKITLNTRLGNFYVDYEDEYSTIKFYGWKLVDNSSGYVIVDTISQNHIYGVLGNIMFKYDGFISGGTYTLKFYVETQHGLSVTKTVDINVEYQSDSLVLSDLIVQPLPNEFGNLIQFSDIKVADGVVTGDIKYFTDYPVKGTTSMQFGKNTQVKWQRSNDSNLTIHDDSSILISCQHDRNDPIVNYTLLTLFGVDDDNNTIKKVLSIDENSHLKFDVIVNGIPISSVSGNTSLYSDEYWSFILVKPTGRIYEIVYKIKDGRLPSDTLVPSDTLLPDMGEWGYEQYYEMQLTDFEVTNVEYDTLILGDIDNIHSFVCDFCYITQQDIDLDILINNFETDTNVELITDEYDFCAKFDQNLNAGNTLIQSLNKVELRKRTGINNYTEYVTTIDLNSEKFVVDYMVSNKMEYTYYLYPQTVDKSMNYISSDSVKLSGDKYCLMIVDDTDTEGLYYLSKMFLFGINVNYGDMSNNTDITVTKNFTPYPFIQSSPSNYWSGSLSGLIGFISCYDGEYQESPLMLEELKGLTTDTRKKFIKDLSGNIFQVQLSSALNVTPSQDGSHHSVTINWTEVGNTKGISVINNPNLSTNAWLLTNNGVASPYLNYTWDDNAVWDDSKFWTGNNDVLRVK